jgi:hypothetical protein
VKDKNLLSVAYDPSEILSLSTFVQRCSTSGQYLLHGLYPLEELKFRSDFNYVGDVVSPLHGTNYEAVLASIVKSH